MNLFIRLLYALSPMLVLTNIECFAGQATSNGGKALPITVSNKSF